MRFFILMFGCALLIYGCRTPYIVSQKSLEKNPCYTSEPDTGVKIRIKNDSKVYFSKFIYRINGTDFKFSGLRPGEFTCYKTLPRLWSESSYEIWFYTSNFSFKKFRKVQKGYVIQQKSENTVGGRIIMEGYQSLIVSVKKDSTNKFYFPQFDLISDRE